MKLVLYPPTLSLSSALIKRQLSLQEEPFRARGGCQAVMAINNSDLFKKSLEREIKIYRMVLDLKSFAFKDSFLSGFKEGLKKTRHPVFV